ncbi:hypothetical protein BgiMline_017740 [Biomphalaria glabrata]|nr:hypothetical protein BgiMline_005374 [Biomphalaria glabrata]
MAVCYKRKRSSLTRHVNIHSILFIVLLGSFILQLAESSSQTQDKEKLLKNDIEILASLFPGSYSNLHQYHKLAQRGLPPNKRSLLIRSEFFLVTSSLFNDSLTIYFQDFTKFSADPFRSGFYSFVFDSTINVFRMRTYKLRNNSVRIEPKSSIYSMGAELVALVLEKQNVSSAELLTYKACDMFWKRIGERTFVGMTGPKCIGSLGKEQVHIGVSMTLTSDKLHLTEGWYNIKNGNQVLEVKVPYIFQKVKASEMPQRDSFEEQVTSTKLKGRRAIQTKSLERRRESKSARTPDGPDSGSHTRILRNFQQVSAALNAGYDVTYRVELSACSMPQQIMLDRMSFGGRVKDFIFVRQDGGINDRTDYVQFVTKKTVTASQGSQILTRELTLLRGGRLNVKVTKSYLDTNKMKKEYMFECRLYDDQKGYGGVKIFTNQKDKPHKLPSYRSIARALDQGHELRVVTDLARCQGLRNKPAIIFGNTIADYDTVNGGKTLEVYLPLLQADTATTMSGEGFVGQFLKNGDVALTKTGRPLFIANISQWSFSPAYHCKLSSQHFLQNNDENLSSVKVFQVR